MDLIYRDLKYICIIEFIISSMNNYLQIVRSFTVAIILVTKYQFFSCFGISNIFGPAISLILLGTYNISNVSKQIYIFKQWKLHYNISMHLTNHKF